MRATHAYGALLGAALLLGVAAPATEAATTPPRAAIAARPTFIVRTSSIVETKSIPVMNLGSSIMGALSRSGRYSTPQSGPTGAPSTPPAADPATPTSSTIGNASYGLYADSDVLLNADLAAVAATGTTMLRIDLPWSYVEGTQGTFDFSRTDRVIDAVLAHGLKPLLLIDSVPAWAHPGSTSRTDPPTSPELITPFVTAATRHYAVMGVTDWEVFNEVNSVYFWTPGPSAAQYVPILKAVYSAIKAVEPVSTVVSGGLLPGLSTTLTYPVIAPQIFLAQMYALGAKNYMDAVGWHPYNWTEDPSTGTPTTSRFLQTSLLRAVMDANGDLTKQIWATEAGWSTCAGGATNGCVTEAQQAQYLAEAVAIWRSDPRNGPFFYFGTRDGSIPTDCSGHYGFLQLDGTRKPVYATLQALTAQG